MFGNLINNTQLIHLVEEERLVSITPWDSGLLKTAHYPLKSKIVYKKNSNGDPKPIHNFSSDGNRLSLAENEYVIIEIQESIKLPEGIIGQFIPSSNLIEQGYGITAGRLEYPYGQKGEPIRFGLKNYLNESNELRAEDQLAYIQFFDLRGLDNNTVKLTERDLKLFTMRLRRAKDDGPFYPDAD